MHYRALEHVRDKELRLNRWDFDAEVTWPGSCRSDLEWWASLVHPVQNSFKSPRFSIQMRTDASLEGWAAVIGDSAFSGTWDEMDGDDIVLLELKAVLLVLHAFFAQPAPLTIHLSTDNMVTKAYVNHVGGQIWRYDAVARRIWRFLEEGDMFIVAFFVPSADNKADVLTRLGHSRRSDRIIASEFMLQPHWFHAACKDLGVYPDIDWFASDDTAQLTGFCAWQSSANASIFDAFAHSWMTDVGYFFPPSL